MRSMELKENYFEPVTKFRRNFNTKRDEDDVFVPDMNKSYSYVNARKYDGEDYMERDYTYKNEGVARTRPLISGEDTDSEREKRMAAHTRLYQEKYNEARRAQEALKFEPERRRLSLRDLDDRPVKKSEDFDQGFDSFVAKEPVVNPERTVVREREFTRPQQYDISNEQYDINREYDSSPYTYNRNRIDNEAYQRTYYTNAPTFRPTSNVYGHATTIADRYKKLFAEKESELKPSEKTMQYAEKKTAEKAKDFKLSKNEAVKTASNAKKGLITLYVTIVVVIAVLIATTGMMIATLSQDISAMEEELNYKQNYIATQSAELSKYDDDNYIYSKAKDQGMKENDQVNTIELIPVKQQSEPLGGDNWFDNLCDFLSGVFGS